MEQLLRSSRDEPHIIYEKPEDVQRKKEENADIVAGRHWSQNPGASERKFEAAKIDERVKANRRLRAFRKSIKEGNSPF